MSASLLSRRDCLRLGGLTAAASALPAFAGEPRPRSAKACILVYLLGGPPQLDMFDPKPHAPAEVRGPFQTIETTLPGVRICEHLPRLAAMTDRYALLRAVSHPNANHTPMIYYTLTGRHVAQPGVDNDISPPRGDDAPHFGSVVAKLRPPPSGLFGFASLPELGVRSNDDNIRAAVPLRGGRAGYLGGVWDPFILNGDPRKPAALPEVVLPADVTRDRFDRRLALLSAVNARRPAATGAFDLLQETAVRLTGAANDDRLYSLDREPAPLRERYGLHRFGQSLLLARRFVEAGVPFVAIHFNHMTRCDGWDTHGQNFKACEQELCPLVDQGLSALLTDLDERGLFDDVVVACYGEFGRTPKINGNAGRDHWGDCSTTFLAGGGIRGGRVHGVSDTHAAYPVSGKVDPVDVQATIFHCLGFEPETLVHDTLARPHPISVGRVIDAVL